MFARLFGVRTVSVHLGGAVSTIDLAREMTPAEITEAEDEANRAVGENRPVRIRYATAEEAAAMPLRKESIRTGTLRLIEVEGVDLSACGGTHVDRTGSIGTIVVNRWERFKGGQRLEFLCGGRTLVPGSGRFATSAPPAWRCCRCSLTRCRRQLSACRQMPKIRNGLSSACRARWHGFRPRNWFEAQSPMERAAGAGDRGG